MSSHYSPKGSSFLAIIFSLLSLISACSAPEKETATNPPSTPSPGSPTAAQTPPASNIAVGHGSSAAVTASQAPSSGEIKWTPPSRWKLGPERPMRAATFLIPAAAGDKEGAECAVFGQIGGGVEANIKRWVGQFEQPDGSSSEAKAKQKKETINGLPVTTVDLTGTFTGSGMAMGQPSEKKTGYRLLGAIIEGPQGEIFFKLTGPAKTVAAAQEEFQSLLKSLKKT
jgi:hypothetical protein